MEKIPVEERIAAFLLPWTRLEMACLAGGTVRIALKEDTGMRRTYVGRGGTVEQALDDLDVAIDNEP
jgi:hypothetical protein